MSGLAMDAPADPVADRAADRRFADVLRFLPSIATLGGLYCGFLSITLTEQGRVRSAVWMVFFSACADTIDGGLARAAGAISPLGKQLDSLSDMVCAGVAPAFLVYHVYFERWGAWGQVVAFSWVALVGLRLARYNSSAGQDPLFFSGVPCPIAAAVVCQYVLFSRATWHDDGTAWVELVIIIVMGALMMSRIPYWRSATLMPANFLHHPYGPGTLATFIAAVFVPSQAFFVATAFSVSCAALVHGVKAMTRVHGGQRGVAPGRADATAASG